LEGQRSLQPVSALSAGRRLLLMLTRKQIRAAQLLARGLTQEEAAKAVGNTSRTLRRWAVTDDFQRAVEDARKQVAQADPSEAEELVKLMLANAELSQPPDTPRVVSYGEDLSPEDREEVDRLFEDDPLRTAVIDRRPDRKHQPLAQRDPLSTSAAARLFVVTSD
jgi:DNA-directed RNA polymerase subunit F